MISTPTLRMECSSDRKPKSNRLQHLFADWQSHERSVQVAIVRDRQFDSHSSVAWRICLPLNSTESIRELLNHQKLEDAATDRIIISGHMRNDADHSHDIEAPAWLEIAFRGDWCSLIDEVGSSVPCEANEVRVVQDSCLRMLALQLCRLPIRSTSFGMSLFEGTCVALLARLQWLKSKSLNAPVQRAEQAEFSPLISRALTLMSSRVHQKVTLDSVATELDVSRSCLARRFRQETGRTFLEHLSLARVEKAKDLFSLYCRPTSLADVAVACGFANHAHMTRVFARHVGMTPREFCKQI